jgi:hypothetical protein
MTVPLVDSIDPVTFQYSSIYNMGTRPIGTWEWGLLYKVHGMGFLYRTGVFLSIRLSLQMLGDLEMTICTRLRNRGGGVFS